jgi:hypothetical protein
VRRLYIIAGVVAGLILFLLISAVLARIFSADGAERGAITSLLRAEARGDTAGVVDRLDGCGRDAACRARAAENAATLKRAGAVSIIQLQPSAGFSLTSTLGTARVAWDVGGSLPIVQCVRVRRAGNAISGLRIELLAITPRLAGDATCPG